MVRNPPFLLVACLTASMMAGAACSTTGGPTASAAVPGGATRNTYDVRDLVLQEQGAGKAWISLTDLAQNLKDATDRAAWERGDGTMQTQDRGYLVVDASPAMHRQVRQALSDMRRLALAKQTAPASSPVTALVQSLTAEEIRTQLAAGLDDRELHRVGFDQVTIAECIDSITSAVQSARERPEDQFVLGRLADSVALYLAARQEAAVRRVAGAASCMPPMRN